MSALHVAERNEAYEVRGAGVSFLGAAFDLLVTAPEGVAKLRELILLLAMQGRLTNQDPRDEPVDHLLQRIRAKKERLIAEGEIKRGKPLASVPEEDAPHKLPQGWRWARMGDVASYIQRGKGPIYAAKSSFRVISQKCVRWYGLDIGPARCITQESLAKYEPVRFLQPGDLLWNSTGTGTIGRACLFPDEYADAQMVADSHVTVVRPLEVDARFLRRWVQSPYVQSQIEEMASGTTNQIELNTSTVVNQLLPLPPVAEQARIVARVEELMQLCDALEAHGRLQDEQHARLVATLFGAPAASESAHALAESWQRIAAHFDLLLDRPEAVDALEQTILQLAVRGLLVPQDPADEPACQLLTRICADETLQLRKIAPGSKDAEDATDPGIPKGWMHVRMGEVFDFLNGYAFKSDWFKPRGIRLVRNVNVAHGSLEWRDAVCIDANREHEFERFSLQKSDVVISLDRPIISTGLKYAVIKESDLPCLLLQRVARLSARAGAVTDEYIHLWLNSPQFISSIDPGRSNGVPHISTKQLSSTPFFLPPLAEQHRIVARVKQLRHLCANLRNRLQQSRTTQSQLADALVSAAAQSPAC